MQNLWNYYQPIYYKLTNNHNTTQQHILTLSSNIPNSKCKKLVLTLTQLIIYKKWQSRNNYKYDKILLTHKIIINKINSQLRIILNKYFKNHNLKDTLNHFDDLFYVRNAIAKIENSTTKSKWINMK